MVVDIALFMIIFIGVMAVTALVFGGWVIVNVARGIGSLLGLRQAPRLMQQHRQAFAPGRAPPPLAPSSRALTSLDPPPPGYLRCNIHGCRHLNPASARFCRHCGNAFPLTAQQAAVPRTALT